MKQVLKLSGWKMQEKSWETVYFWNIGLRNSLISCKNAVNANTRTHALAIQIYCKIELRLIEQWITGNQQSISGTQKAVIVQKCPEFSNWDESVPILKFV